MEKLPIENEENGKCPKCSNTLMFAYGKVKEKKLRLKMWIAFALFILFALPICIDLITLNFNQLKNPGWWINLSFTLFAFCFYLKYLSEVKEFESVYRDFACCEKCKTTWLFHFSIL